MINVGITGQPGFVGTHLYNELGLLSDSVVRIPFEDSFFESEAQLRAFVKRCDLQKMERYVYNHSSAVTTIDEVFYNTIAGRFKDRSKLHIIPNFVDTELYNPKVRDRSELNADLFPQTDSLKLLYAGNIGFAQAWEPLISLAHRTTGEPIEYFVIGEGVMKPFIEEKKGRWD